MLKDLFHFLCSIRIANIDGRHPRISSAAGRSSNMMFLVWAIFGGFISHFLLANYLSVLLRPDFEKPVETAEDLIERDLTPFYQPGRDFLIQFFAESPSPAFRQLSKTLVIPKDWPTYFDMMDKVVTEGATADIGTVPWWEGMDEDELVHWYR